MISLQNLTRHYGATVAVKGVTTQIRRGEIVGLLGHNGAGKTTVMKILTGFLDATDGHVTVDGVDVETDRATVQRRIGYLPENAPLYPEMTVYEYLSMMAELRGVDRARIHDAVVRVVLATGLSDRIGQVIDTLSKGLRQRVGIAQAIVHDPDVLVLDEPTNGLDPMQIHQIRELIRHLGKTSTIILSTHILQEIEAVCDRVLIMIQGELVADAPLEDLVRSKRIKLTVAKGTREVPRTLGRLEAVVEVLPLEADGDNDAYAVHWSGDVAPVPAVIKAATEAGWTIASVAPEQRTLEHVFQDLQRDHIARAGGAA